MYINSRGVTSGILSGVVSVRGDEIEDVLRLALEKGPDGFVLLDETGHMTWVNEMAHEVVGLESGEMVGRHFTDFCPISLQDVAQEFFEQACDGEQVRARFPVVGADPSPRQTEFAARRFDTDDGFRVMLVVRDLSRETEAFERLERVTERLAEVEDMQLVAQLAGGLVHDLNNMLAVIGSYGQLLRTELSDQPELVDDIDEIIKASETASSLSRRLLAIGRGQADEDEHPTDLDLNDEIERLTSFLERVMPPRVLLETDLCSETPIVELPPVQLEQAVLNLILNARDAIAQDGRVCVKTQVVEDPDGFDSSVAEVCVVDNGSGIPADDLERIFEPFFTTKGPSAGTGMGLPMVKRIMDDAGGDIEVDTKLGRGTEVRLRLPLSSPNTPSLGVEESTDAIDETGNERILVVDGNVTSRRLIQRVLAGHGYDVLVASDQSDARQIVVGEVKDIDLLILDAGPDNRRARELTRDLRRSFQRLEVVYTVEDPESVSSPDGVKVLERPITPSSLAREIRLALDAR